MLSNTQFSMAVHVMTALAYNRGEVLPSDMLAETVGTNPSFLRQLIGRLREAGLVETRLGKGGGTLLVGDPADITLLTIYRATERRPVMAAHACDPDAACPVARCMGRVLGDLEGKLEDAIGAQLSATSLADIVGRYLPGARKPARA